VIAAMKIVTPFRPFAPESVEHFKLGPFDWHGAIEMLRASAARFCQCETFVITDVDHDAPGPAHYFDTSERRLMLWILDVSLRYLESEHFDQDTVMVSPDILVLGDLRPYFVADLGLVVRTGEKFKDTNRTVLNGVQWWRHASKKRLVHFFRRALAIARELPEERIVWGADTDPLIQLTAPLIGGARVKRSGLTFYGHERLMQSLSSQAMVAIDAGEPLSRPSFPLLDFKYDRKHYMRRTFDALVGSAVAA
jgi:hypothetical protein